MNTQILKLTKAALVIIVALFSQNLQAQSGINTITGKVFLDPNLNGIYDLGEILVPLSSISLYNDVNGNGAVDQEDNLIQTTESTITGDYAFIILPGAGPIPLGQESNYIIVMDDANFSPEVIMTSEKAHTAKFNGIGNIAFAKDFSYVGPVSTCLGVAEKSKELYRFNRINGKFSKIGNLGSFKKVEAISLSQLSDSLYATNEGTFGWINLNSGAFSPIGTIGEEGQGSDGLLDFDEVTGLACDRTRASMWAIQRRKGNDVLLQINESTGAFVKDAFGPNVDYLVVSNFNDGDTDIDDIAIDNASGKAFVVSNKKNINSNLYELNLTNGVLTFLGQMSSKDIKGLGSDSEGNLIGSKSGNSSKLFKISKNAEDTQIGSFANASDFKACDCFSYGSANLISGVVFNDNNSSSIFDASESGLANVEIMLFDDVNLNGTKDFGENLIQSTFTSPKGVYAFSIPQAGNYGLALNTASIPSGSLMTTSSSEEAYFAGLGQTSSANNFGVSGGSLPIELISFDALLVRDEVKIMWSSAVEINNDYYIVEKSSNGVDFEEMALVNGQGNSYTVTNYQEYDNSPAAGMNYYRLKQVDFNGASTYSKVRVIEVEAVKIPMNVFPSIGNGIVNIELAKVDVSTTVYVLNLNGQVVYSKEMSTNSTQIDITNLPNGVYFVALENGNKSVKIIKN